MLAPYKFNKKAIEHMNKKEFLQTFKPLLPHLDLEGIWAKLFPLSKSSSRDKPKKSGE